MEHAKHYVKPVQTPSTATHIVDTVYNNAWAGYLVPASLNGNPTYNEVWSQWKQPSYSGNADPSFWVGLGGYNTGFTIQSGADSNASLKGGSSRYEFWVEDYPQGTTWEAAPAINGGDTAYVEVYSGGGSTSTAFLENISTGNYTSITFNSPYVDRSTADFIQEAIDEIYGSWGTTTFSNCNLSTTTGNSGQLTNYNLLKIIMTNTVDSGSI